MKCPNCNSIIPDDSQYCPDCGAVIEREEDLRKEASSIVSSYKKGYDYYVSNGTLPQFSSWLSVDAYKRIISFKSSIVNKHNDILRAEKERREREERARRDREERERQQQHQKDILRNKAASIFSAHKKGYEYYATIGILPQYSSYLSIDDYKKIISYENCIVNKDSEVLSNTIRDKINEDNKTTKKNKGSFWEALIVAWIFGLLPLVVFCAILDMSIKAMFSTIIIGVVFIAWVIKECND